MGGIVIDVFVIAIFVLNLIIGYKKGLVKVLFNIAAFFISVIVALFLFNPCSEWVINNTQMDEFIKDSIITNFSKKEIAENKEEQQEKENIEEQKDENKTEKKEKNAIQAYIENEIKQTTSTAKEEALQFVAGSISIKIVKILTGIALFIVVRIVLLILKLITEALEDFPIIKDVNEVGGAIYGGFKAIVIIYIILTILFFIISAKSDGILANSIEQSVITKFLYENNILIKYCLFGKNLL